MHTYNYDTDFHKVCPIFNTVCMISMVFIIIIPGGFDGVDCLNLVEMYEPRMNKWTEVSPMNQKRDGLSLISYGGYIYAIGGIDDSCFLNTAEYYDPTTNVWTETVPMILPRASAGSAVLIDGVNI